MRKYILMAAFLLGNNSAYALQAQPWFSEVYEFVFFSRYSFAWYPGISHAIVQPAGTSHINLLHFDLGIAVAPQCSFDADFELSETSRQSFGFRSLALQGRYLCMDDIIGDPVSLSVGFNARYTGHSAITDVSCPYYGDVDFEANIALGREFEVRLSPWRTRLWGFGSLGQANRGSPWLRAIIGFDASYQEMHRLAMLFNAAHSFGRRRNIDINNFHGYGKYRQKFIDLSLQYGLRMGVWGMLSFEYRRRLLAKTCPENVNTLGISYLLSFSF